MADIAQVVLDEHDLLCRAFAALDETTDTAQLTVLSRRLEAHADADMAILYPVLVQAGDDADDYIDEYM